MPDQHASAQRTAPDQQEQTSCPHVPTCPPADAVDREAARVISRFNEQGWSLLCNGVIQLHDTGDILPDNTTIEPHRGPAIHALAA